MKIRLCLLLAPMVLAASSAQAILLLQDSFSRTGSVLGTQPDVLSVGTAYNAPDWQDVQTTDGSVMKISQWWNRNQTFLALTNTNQTLSQAFPNSVVSIQADVNGSASRHYALFGFAQDNTSANNLWASWPAGSQKLSCMFMGPNDGGQPDTFVQVDAGGAFPFTGNAANSTATLKLTYHTASHAVAFFIDGVQLGTTYSLGSDQGYRYLTFGNYDGGPATFDNLIVDVTPVPEPSALALLGGLAALGAARRYRPRSI